MPTGSSTWVPAPDTTAAGSSSRAHQPTSSRPAPPSPASTSPTTSHPDRRLRPADVTRHRGASFALGSQDARSVTGWMADRHPMELFGLLAVAVAGLYLFNLSISPGFTADEVRYAQLSQHIVTFNAISVTGPFLVHPPWTFSRCAVAQHHRSRIRPGAVRADQHQVFS